MLDQQASEQTLSVVAREAVMFSERAIGTSLGMKYTEIKNCIPENERDVCERKFHVLYQWTRLKGKNATNRALIRGLVRCGSDQALLDRVVSDLLIDDLDDVSHDGPTTTTGLPVASPPNQRLTIPISFFVIVCTVVSAGFPWVVNWLQETLLECERRKTENVSLRKEYAEKCEENAQLHEAYAQLRTQCTQAENERDDEREKSHRLSVELEKLRHSETLGSVCSSSTFKEEPPGDRKVPENTTSFSSSGSTGQLDICTTQLGNFPLPFQLLDLSSSQQNPFMPCQSLDVPAGQHNDSSTLHSFKIVANVELNISSVSSLTQEAIYPADTSSSESQDVPPQVNESSELEALTPDMDEDCADSSLNDDNDDNKTSECTPSPTTVSQIQSESNLEVAWLEIPIEGIAHVGTKRDYSLLHDEDAQMEWANSPGPKRQKIG